jgi:hypothetical protein
LDIFDLNNFKEFIIQRAKDSDFVGNVIDDLIEPPPPNSGDAIPFLGETKIYELILKIAAGGDIFLNVSGTWIGRRPEDTSDEESLRFIQGKAFRTGHEMRQVQLGLPGAVGGGTVTVLKPSTIYETPVSVVDTPRVKNGKNSVYLPAISTNATEESLGMPPVIVIPSNKSKKSQEPATGINLSGCFESWGISSNQSIESARIEFSGLTAQQIKQILQRIPSTFKASLDITYKEGGLE